MNKSKFSNEPRIIHERRKKSYELFSEKPMPSHKDEEWRYTAVSTLNMDFEEGKQETKFDFPESKEKGVVFTDMKTALTEHFHLMKEHLPNSLLDEDKVSAMHAAFWNEGVFIYVPKNVDVAVPLRNEFLGKGGIFNHTLIIVEENSSLAYIEEHVSTEAFRNDAVEIYLKANARLSFCSLQDNMRTKSISNWKARLEQDAGIEFVLGLFGGDFSRVKIDTYFAGKGSVAEKSAVFYGTGQKSFDITTNAHHLVPNTTCNILVKGVLDGKAKSVYRGKIKINKEAQQTNSYLSDHMMVLSDDANSNSIPSLEIDANEVRASHGATQGRPDEEEIFYLMARGLKRERGRKINNPRFLFTSH
jgi:FeS assembly protein SufD